MNREKYIERLKSEIKYFESAKSEALTIGMSRFYSGTVYGLELALNLFQEEVVRKENNNNDI